MAWNMVPFSIPGYTNQGRWEENGTWGNRDGRDLQEGREAVENLEFDAGKKDQQFYLF